MSECPSVHSQNGGPVFFSQNIFERPSVPVSVFKIEGHIFFLRINILECTSVRVTVLKIEGQIFFLRINIFECPSVRSQNRESIFFSQNKCFGVSECPLSK